MSAKHTPGPWTDSQPMAHVMTFRTIVDAQGFPLAQIVDRSGREGNAALIAVAPELLEALEALVTAVDGACKGGGQLRSRDFYHERKNAHALIAKARQ